MADLDEGDWALLEDAPWQVQIHDGAPYDEPPDLTEAEQAAAPSAGLPVDREALGYVYPYQAACTTSTKLTATQLKGREKDKEIAEDTVQPYVHREFAAPRFLSGQKPMGPEARGTAVHLVMQYVDLSGKTDAAATVADLVERRLLTAEQAQSVDLAAIRQFLASPLAQELRQADELEQEYRFSLLVPAEDYYPELAEGDEVMLQGVVDLYAVKDGAVTVVDFKTDQVSEKNLPEKLAFYRPQLDAYSAALEKILGLPVNRKILYFFSAGLAVEP